MTATGSNLNHWNRNRSTDGSLMLLPLTLNSIFSISSILYSPSFYSLFRLQIFYPLHNYYSNTTFLSSPFYSKFYLFHLSLFLSLPVTQWEQIECSLSSLKCRKMGSKNPSECPSSFLKCNTMGPKDPSEWSLTFLEYLLTWWFFH